MPQGDNSKDTDKQKRQAEHIEKSNQKKGISESEAEKKAWATINSMYGWDKRVNNGRGSSGGKTNAKKVVHNTF